MKDTTNKNMRMANLFTAIAFMYTVAVKAIDVQQIGPKDTSVGFAAINAAVARFCPYNDFWYKLTQSFGILAIAICATFGCVGAYQLFITRKKLLKVDRTILCLGGLYSLTIALYVAFEKLAVNYRPGVLPGSNKVEASFPSSHTMLIFVVMVSAFMVMDEYVKNEKLAKVLKILCIIITVVTFVGRIQSGAHWISDIFGGILYSIALLFWFNSIRIGEVLNENRISSDN